MDEFTEWHSIRPWRPTLALSTREITSVSVTFILSSPYSSDSIGSLGMSSDEDADSGVEDECEPGRTQIISDVLAKGLSVKVNGIPWQRVLIRIDEEMDEAVIILFGLMPGRQYDVELGIVPGERTLRGQITTGESSSCSRIGYVGAVCITWLQSASSGEAEEDLCAAWGRHALSKSSFLIGIWLWRFFRDLPIALDQCACRKRSGLPFASVLA